MFYTTNKLQRTQTFWSHSRGHLAVFSLCLIASSGVYTDLYCDKAWTCRSLCVFPESGFLDIFCLWKQSRRLYKPPYSPLVEPSFRELYVWAGLSALYLFQTVDTSFIVAGCVAQARVGQLFFINFESFSVDKTAVTISNSFLVPSETLFMYCLDFSWGLTLIRKLCSFIANDPFLL